MKMKDIAKGFTLIELLIVVAIIAILAAIAVPNFLEAQVRSKVSRTKSDQRTMATGLEAYYVDNNSYPQCNSRGTALRYTLNATAPLNTGAEENWEILERLSSPIAYLTTGTFADPFLIKTRKSAASSAAMVAAPVSRVTPDTDIVARLNTYIYQSVSPTQRATVVAGGFEPNRVKASGWFLHSVGPDSNYYNLGGVLANERTKEDGPILLIYDPTNGTVSEGSVWRTGGSASGNAAYAAGSGLRQAIDSQR